MRRPDGHAAAPSAATWPDPGARSAAASYAAPARLMSSVTDLLARRDPRKDWPRSTEIWVIPGAKTPFRPNKARSTRRNRAWTVEIAHMQARTHPETARSRHRSTESGTHPAPPPNPGAVLRGLPIASQSRPTLSSESVAGSGTRW
jgi:hypothetical protein